MTTVTAPWWWPACWGHTSGMTSTRTRAWDCATYSVSTRRADKDTTSWVVDRPAKVPRHPAAPPGHVVGHTVPTSNCYGGWATGPPAPSGYVSTAHCHGWNWTSRCPSRRSCGNGDRWPIRPRRGSAVTGGVAWRPGVGRA